MYQSPENKGTGEPLENIDLDFTKPEDTLEEVRVKIASAEKGIKLAEQLNDMDRLGTMMATLQKLQEKEKKLLAEAPKQEFWVPSSEAQNEADFDNALNVFGDSRDADRLDAAKKRSIR